MSATLLEAKNVSFIIDNNPILNGVNFALRSGQFTGLIGPNGAGKSTLLKVMSGLWRGASGEITLLDRPLETHYSAREIARVIAHVPQSTQVDFSFTAREIALMGRSPHLGRFQIESARDREIADEAMRATDTLAVAERLIHTLSGGEAQRVIIARALAQQPKILLLDEPTNNLDIKHQLSILNLAATLAHRDGLGVVAAIHDLPLAARFCDRLVMINEGRIMADGSPEEVLTPTILASSFGINARVYRDPLRGYLALSIDDLHEAQK